jgi:hypothetical protein
VRVDGQEPDIRRERGTSSRLTAKSISIKHAERRSGDCAWKAAELTSGGLQEAEVSRGHIRPAVGAASEALQAERWSEQIGQAGNEDTKARTRGAASRS